jgi:hypothetical protein
MAEAMQAANDEQVASAAARPDTATMTDRQLAEAVLARRIRPRVAEVGRLAEAVLAKSGKKAGKKAKGGRLAKIPGQGKKKKKKS